MDTERQKLPRLFYRAKEAAELLGLSLRTVYEGVYEGRIPSRKIGNARLIPASWLEAESNEDADRVLEKFADAARSNSPKNRYSLGNCPRGAREQLRLLRNLFSHVMRQALAA